MKNNYQVYGISPEREKALTNDIEEANERLQVLGDAGNLDNAMTNVTVLGLDYVVEEIFLGVSEENQHADGNCTFRCSDSLDNYEFVASDKFFDEYLGILRTWCITTHTWTFQEAEPEEYKEAKAAEKAMHDPSFKETFEFSKDPKYDTAVSDTLLYRIHDNQEIWWQRQGED